MEKERISHPAFGQISFSRISSNAKTQFYGSELAVDNFIELTVKTSEVERDLTRDWHFGKATVLKLRLTPVQFSELLVSMNVGDGIPCTLEFYDGKRVEKIDFPENRKDFMQRKFQERMKDFASKLSENKKIAKALIAKKTLSKADQDALNWQIDWIIQETSQNIPFFAQCFQEQMDKIVLDAKTEIESAILHKITTLGLEALHKENKLINS